MAETSQSWATILALAAQLATITTVNGYLTDVGTNVWTEEGQRTHDHALGLMIYSESINGPGVDGERPAKPIRDIALLIEAAIGTDLDNACERIHAVIEDIETCMARYAKAQAQTPSLQRRPMHVADIAILDRPEGAAVIAMQARIVTRYLR